MSRSLTHRQRLSSPRTKKLLLLHPVALACNFRLKFFPSLLCPAAKSGNLQTLGQRCCPFWGACTLSLTPWGFLDASHDANETRYHESRPQSVGGTGDSGLNSKAQRMPARSGLPCRTHPSKPEEAAGTRTIRSSGGPKSRL